MVRLRTLVPVAALTSILDSVTTVYAFHVLTGKGCLVVERSVMTAEIIRHVLATDPLITSAVLASFFLLLPHGFLCHLPVHMWNPVKELKEINELSSHPFSKPSVESGEGIERS